MLNIIKEKLNLNNILKDIQQYCYSEISVEKFNNLKYISDYEILKKVHNENEEIENLMRKYPTEFNLKIYNYYDSIKKSEIGSILYEKELFYILYSIKNIRLFKNKFELINKQELGIYKYTNSYIENIKDSYDIEQYLTKIIDEDGYIKSTASDELFIIKNNIKKLNEKSENILKNILRKNINKLTEAIITKRNDRSVILVKPEYKNDFGGIIHDESASGNTFYVEPRENLLINNEIATLKRKEKEEILKILKEATELIASNKHLLRNNLYNFSELEFIFSKVNFSIKNNFTKPVIIKEQIIDLKNMYNPLISKDSLVKNSIYLDNDKHSLIITGPNTGGKTVVLKTVGICVLLSHLGLYIPADNFSKIGSYDKIFVDIGDDQSIENNLSTFSSHMTNIIKILENVNNKSIVLLDELCSGTDPSEGAAISMALLNELKKNKATVLSTTHYPEIKDYCFNSDYYINASLEFDFEKLKPTYKFIMGLPGKSNAINISMKLGLNKDIISEANNYIKETEKENSSYIEKLADSIKQYENKIEYLNSEIIEIKEIKTTLEKEIKDYYYFKDSLYENLYEKFNEDIETKKEEMLDIYKQFKSNMKIKQHEYNELTNKMDNLKTKFVKNNINFENNGIINFKVGEDVKVKKYNQRATILKIDNDKIYVKMGSLKLFVNKDEVSYIEREVKKDTTLKVTKSINNNISLTINVIGKNTEEALMDIEDYIDKVLLSGYETFTIIHGLGAGILKNNIAKYLKNNKYVSTYRTGNQNEGGLGVTVVTMK